MGPANSPLPSPEGNPRRPDLPYESALKAARILLTDPHSLGAREVCEPLGYRVRSLSREERLDLLLPNADALLNRLFELQGALETVLAQHTQQCPLDLVNELAPMMAQLLTGDLELDLALGAYFRGAVAMMAVTETTWDTSVFAPLLGSDDADLVLSETDLTAARGVIQEFSGDCSSRQVTTRYESFLAYLRARGATALLIEPEDPCARSTPAAPLTSYEIIEQMRYGESRERFTWWNLQLTPEGTALWNELANLPPNSLALAKFAHRLCTDERSLTCCKLGSRSFTTTSLMGRLKHRFLQPGWERGTEDEMNAVRVHVVSEGGSLELTSRAFRREDDRAVVIATFTPRRDDGQEIPA